MTVGELMKRLAKEDPKRIVILSKDEEGNAYKELRSVESGHAFKGDSIGLETLSAADKKKGYTENDLMKGGQPAVVFWP